VPVTAPTAKQLADEIARRLRALRRRDVTSVRAVRREFSRRLSDAAADVVLDVGRRLVGLPEFSPRFVAYELIHYHPAALGRLRASHLAALGRGLDSWQSVDTFGIYLSGPAWRARQVPDTLILRWARSKDRWWRRAALVSTVPLNQKVRGGTGQGDPARTLPVCARLAGDRDDMVVKALSWALRELARRDPDAVRGFLAEHDTALAARVKREVGNKLRTGLKNPRPLTRTRRP
jgi:3-methyladenine DNA glycosylase AlkD